jgi:hypothetical protein
MALLFSNRYASLDLDQSVVRYVRNSEAFPSIEDITQSHGDVARVLDRLGRARYALLVDLREARPVSSAEAEQAMSRERKRLLFGFSRVATLVKSAAGALQVQRHAREDGIAMRVFLDDERGALQWVRSSGPVSERAPNSGIIESVPPPSSRIPDSAGRVPDSVGRIPDSVRRLGTRFGR